MKQKILGAILALLLSVIPASAIQEGKFPPAPSDVHIIGYDYGNCGPTYVLAYFYDLDGDPTTVERVDFALPEGELFAVSVIAKGALILVYVRGVDQKIYIYNSEEAENLGSPCEIASALVAKHSSL